MTFGEIKNTDYEMRKEQQAKREEELKQILEKCLDDIGCDVSNVSINFEAYKEAGSVSYTFKLDDGFTDDDSICWDWDKSAEDLADSIKSRIDYIVKLRNQYPEYAEVNDYIQERRLFEKKCDLRHNGYLYPCTIKANLCGYLKLPNTTDCSCGGGDYEIKRTPGRLEDFNKNIDTLCIFLAGCISDLQNMKYNRKEK